MNKRNMNSIYDDFFGSSNTESPKDNTKSTKRNSDTTLDAFLKSSDDLLKSIEKQGKELREQSLKDGLISDEELAKMEASIQKDFGNLRGELKKESIKDTKELVTDLKVVKDLEELLTKELVGQKEFIKRLMIGFKRPNVSGI